jgi:hypothetical protein
MAMANDNMIVDYVLDPLHPRRLDIAMELVKNYPQIKRDVIFDFATRLEAKFAEQFPTFTINVTLKRYERERYVGVTITNSSWQNLRINLEAQTWGCRGFVIGVQNAEESGSDMPELSAALNSQYGAGDRSSGWPYYRKVDNFADWDNETLVELRKPSTLDFFVDQFESIRLIAEPIINRALLPPET